MHPYRANSFLTVLLIIFIGIKASGQTSTVSNPTSQHDNNPYSRYGIGTLSSGDNIVLQGMGNISSAYENPYEMNTENPASYSFLKLTTYEAGLYGTMRTVATNDLNYQTGTATLSYMNIGIPLGKKAGLCIGIRPVSNMFYSLADTAITDLGNTQGLYSGSGSVNYFYLGAAYKYKSFSFGINAGYMFGQLRNSIVLNNIDTASKAFNSDFSKYTKIGGIYWKAGIMYEHEIKHDLSLRIGATLSLKQNLNTSVTEYGIGTYSLVDSFIEDTAYASPTIKGKMVMPMTYGIGVQLLSTDKWMVGIDYSATQWTQFRNMGLSDSLTDAYKISIGGEYTPNASNTRSYFSRATYRAGLYYGKDPVYLLNTGLMIYGITAGASLPIRRSTSHVHLGIDVGSLGTKSNNLIKETYVRFSVGFSFNDRWFVKRKYD